MPLILGVLASDFNLRKNLGQMMNARSRSHAVPSSFVATGETWRPCVGPSWGVAWMWTSS